MNQFSSGGAKPWEVYTTTDPSSSQTVASTESPGKNVGSSLNAISFGFVATAILIAMFLIMAIFEHLLRPRSEDGAEGSVDTGPVHILEKLASPQNVSLAYANDISILMPGQRCPTFIAKPAPLPCRREGIYWPSYDQSSVNFASP